MSRPGPPRAARRAPRRRSGRARALPRAAMYRAAVLVLAQVTVVLDDVEHARHRHEDEHAVAARQQPLEQLVEHDHLAAVLHHVLAVDEGRPGLGPLEEVRVVAHLAQVHDDVLRVRRALAAAAVAERLQVAHQHLAVPLRLHRHQPAVESLGMRNFSRGWRPGLGSAPRPR